MNSSGVHSFSLQFVPAMIIVQGGKVKAAFDGRKRPVGINAQGHAAPDWCAADILSVVGPAHNYMGTSVKGHA